MIPLEQARGTCHGRTQQSMTEVLQSREMKLEIAT